MRKVVGALLILAVVAVVVVLAAIPRYAPPRIERFAIGKLAEFGIDAGVAFGFGYRWRNGPDIEGGIEAEVLDTPWRAKVMFDASCCEWVATGKVPETRFSESDPLVRTLLEKYLPKGVSNLVFSGSVKLDAKAAWTFRKPVSVWDIKTSVEDLNASMVLDGQKISLEGLSASPGASGLANHVDIAPMFLRARSVSFGEFHFTNFYATVRATEKSLIVNEAGAGFCGGKVNVYSLHLNPQNLNAGFTLFLDDVDAGEALAHVNGFEGEASGRLHGKLKAFVKEGGKSIRLRDMFLYSTPGETGKLRMTNPEVVMENFAYAGLDDAARANVSDALTDIDYKVLRMDLDRTGERSARLTVQVGGTATRGKTTVPVDITVNINGELEQLLNTGLGLSAKMKGKK